MKYTEKTKDGKRVIRWDTKKKYTKNGLEKQRKEFEQAAKSGKMLCLTDIMINHGM